MNTKPSRSSSHHLPTHPQPFQFIYWQIIFIYFWVFSLLGHYLELIWAQIDSWINQKPLWQPLTYTIIPLAPPYGLGVVVIILLIIPLIKKYKLHVPGAFTLSVIMTGVVEYICATILINLTGHNSFWDYSGEPFNLQGKICLENCLLFGLAATFFIYVIYPSFNKLLRKLSSKQLKYIFWVLLITYSLDWLLAIILGLSH